MQELSKVDEKGRLLIPSEIRRAIGLKPGVEVLVGVDGRRAVLSSVTDKKFYEIKIIMKDLPGTLAKIAEFLSDNKFDIIMSESRSLERTKTAEWDITGKYEGNLSALVSKLKALDFISGVIIKK